ncbi:uncharacterized protein LOC142893391 isoform X2 [Nelusetta ayraudi]|uniref:uncharacterized protein LOC142893391 isoform X1 n=1 Tax=Nelusetta ayraudi TaxID=303726 RepID=UPI003F70C0CC
MSPFVSLQALLVWSVSSGMAVVNQSPDVSVMEGETVNITCCWPEQGTRFKVNWMKNQTEVKIETFEAKQDNEQKSPTCSSLTFESIRREDSGKYTCKLNVEIPRLASYEGHGTLITVLAAQNKGIEKEKTYLITVAGDSHEDELQYNLLRCLPVLALFISFCFLYRSSTKAQQKTAVASVNAPCSDRVEEENPEEEEHGQRPTETE